MKVSSRFTLKWIRMFKLKKSAVADNKIKTCGGRVGGFLPIIRSTYVEVELGCDNSPSRLAPLSC